ncbi:MAG: phosphoribosylglycinamide formyltransferase [Gammaproteobacteria bacterium]|nr:phosphoribosylglycinamide formyltransferase [Gammaproteobacteria bacterium]
MTEPQPLRVAVLVSGSGTNLQAIIDAARSDDLPVRIAAVLSDNPDAMGLDRAREYGIPAIAIDFHGCTDRATYDRQLRRQLADLNPDLVVLAGYMRILDDDTVNDFAGRMLNVHPSLLPAYPGLHTHRRVLEAGEDWHGTTVHFVIPELDAGPPVVQYRLKVHPEDTEQSLRERVQAGEYQIYPLAIGWIADGRLVFADGGPQFDGKPLTQPQIIDADY